MMKLKAILLFLLMSFVSMAQVTKLPRHTMIRAYERDTQPFYSRDSTFNEYNEKNQLVCQRKYLASYVGLPENITKDTSSYRYFFEAYNFGIFEGIDSVMVDSGHYRVNFFYDAAGNLIKKEYLKRIYEPFYNALYGKNYFIVRKDSILYHPKMGLCGYLVWMNINQSVTDTLAICGSGSWKFDSKFDAKGRVISRDFFPVQYVSPTLIKLVQLFRDDFRYHPTTGKVMAIGRYYYSDSRYVFYDTLFQYDSNGRLKFRAMKEYSQSKNRLEWAYTDSISYFKKGDTLITRIKPLGISDNQKNPKLYYTSYLYVPDTIQRVYDKTLGVVFEKLSADKGGLSRGYLGLVQDSAYLLYNGRPILNFWSPFNLKYIKDSDGNVLRTDVKRLTFHFYDYMNMQAAPYRIVETHSDFVDMHPDVITEMEKENTYKVGNSSLAVSPNPSGEKVQVRSQEAGALSVYSLSGLQVYADNTVKIQHDFTVETWEKGIYIVKVGKQSTRLVVE